MDEHVETLFTIIARTIEAEDARFFEAMEAAASRDSNRCYAGRYPPGLNSYFYEEGVVFLVFRALLAESQRFPFEVTWECEYPAAGAGRMDLGIFERGLGQVPGLVGAVEAKWWKTDAQVRAEVEKLGQLPRDVRKFILLIGTWQRPPTGAIAEAIAEGLSKLGLNQRPRWIHLFPIRGEPIPTKYRWSDFYVVLAEVTG